MANHKIEKACQFIVERCQEEGIVVHRYDTKSSGSIYFKFDWGVAHSLRISDHNGIEKYHYKFNLIQSLPEIRRICYNNNNYCNYYPFNEFFTCLDDILTNRKEVMERYGTERYLEEMKKVQERIERLPKEKLYPFWKYGRRVD